MERVWYITYMSAVKTHLWCQKFCDKLEKIYWVKSVYFHMHDTARLKSKYVVGKKPGKTYQYKKTLFYVISVSFDRYNFSFVPLHWYTLKLIVLLWWTWSPHLNIHSFFKNLGIPKHPKIGVNFVFYFIKT